MKAQNAHAQADGQQSGQLPHPQVRIRVWAGTR